MVRSFKRIWAVALLTCTEGLRQPAFYFIFACCAAMTALAPSFAFFHLGEEGKMVTDLGLSTILTFSTLLALLTASSTVTDEIEGRTALTMLSKPLRREEFIAGKFIGVACTAAALALLMSVVLLVTLRSQKFESYRDRWFSVAVASGLLIFLLLFAIALVARLFLGRGPGLARAFWIAYASGAAFVLIFLGKISDSSIGWDWRLLTGLAFIALHSFVISAAAVALATRLTLVQSAIGTAVFFVVGHASGALLAPFRDAGHRLTAFGSVLRALLPDIDQFNITDALATAYLDAPVSVPWDVIGGASLYALLYGAALLALAAALFSRRELG